jgi:hypothetical protein
VPAEATLFAQAGANIMCFYVFVKGIR